MMGFDPMTMQPSRERPAILQPPVLATMGGRLPLTKGGSRPRQDAKYDVLSENYERQLVREDSAMDELPDRGPGVWGRLGRSSSPNVMGNVCAEECGEVCDGRCLTNHGMPFGTLAAEVLIEIRIDVWLSLMLQLRSLGLSDLELSSNI